MFDNIESLQAFHENDACQLLPGWVRTTSPSQEEIQRKPRVEVLEILIRPSETPRIGAQFATTDTMRDREREFLESLR